MYPLIYIYDDGISFVQTIIIIIMMMTMIINKKLNDKKIRIKKYI